MKIFSLFLLLFFFNILNAAISTCVPGCTPPTVCMNGGCVMQTFVAQCDASEIPCGMFCCDNGCHRATMTCQPDVKICDAAETRCGAGPVALCCGKSEVCDKTLAFPYCREVKICDAAEIMCGAGRGALCCGKRQYCDTTTNALMPRCAGNRCGRKEQQCGAMCCDLHDVCDKTTYGFPVCTKPLICDMGESQCGSFCCDRHELCDTTGEIPHCRKVMTCDKKEVKCGRMCCSESEYCDSKTNPGMPTCKWTLTCDATEFSCGSFCCKHGKTYCDTNTNPNLPQCKKRQICDASEVQCGTYCCGSQEKCDYTEPLAPFCQKYNICDANEMPCGGRFCCKFPQTCDTSNSQNPRCAHMTVCPVPANKCGDHCCNSDETCDTVTSTTPYCRPTKNCGAGKFQCGQNCCIDAVQTCDKSNLSRPVCARPPDFAHVWLQATAPTSSCLTSEFSCEGQTKTECCKYGSKCMPDGTCSYDTAVHAQPAACAVGSSICGQTCCDSQTHECASILTTNSQRCIVKEYNGYVDQIYHPQCPTVCGHRCCNMDEACVVVADGFGEFGRAEYRMKCVEEAPKGPYSVVKEADRCEYSNGFPATKCGGVCCKHGHFCVTFNSQDRCLEHGASYVPMPIPVNGTYGAYPAQYPMLQAIHVQSNPHCRVGEKSCNDGTNVGCCMVGTSCAETAGGKKICVGVPHVTPASGHAANPHPNTHSNLPNRAAEAKRIENERRKAEASRQAQEAAAAEHNHNNANTPPAPLPANTPPSNNPKPNAHADKVIFSLRFSSFPSPYCVNYISQVQTAFMAVAAKTGGFSRVQVQPGQGCLPPPAAAYQPPAAHRGRAPRYTHYRRKLQATAVTFHFVVTMAVPGVKGKMAIANMAMSDDFSKEMNAALSAANIVLVNCEKATHIDNMPVICDPNENLCGVSCCSESQMCYMGTMCMDASHYQQQMAAQAAAQQPAQPAIPAAQPQPPAIPATQPAKPATQPAVPADHQHAHQHSSQPIHGGTMMNFMGQNYEIVPLNAHFPRGAFCGMKKRNCGPFDCCEYSKQCLRLGQMYQCTKMKNMYENYYENYGGYGQYGGFNQGYPPYGYKRLAQANPQTAPKLAAAAPQPVQANPQAAAMGFIPNPCDAGEKQCGATCCDQSEVCNPATFMCGPPLPPLLPPQTAPMQAIGRRYLKN